MSDWKVTTPRLSNHDHRLIWPVRVWHQPPPLTIRQKIELFQNGLSNQHLIAQYHCFFKSVTGLAFENDWTGNAHRFRAAIGEPCNPLTPRLQTQSIGNMNRNN